MVKEMTDLFRRVGTLVREPVDSRRYPNPRVLEECRALGNALAATVLQKATDVAAKNGILSHLRFEVGDTTIDRPPSRF